MRVSPDGSLGHVPRGAGFVTMTVAAPVWPAPFALTVNVPGRVSAINTPSDVILPPLALQRTGMMTQLPSAATPYARNWRLSPGRSSALVGATTTPTTWLPPGGASVSSGARHALATAVRSANTARSLLFRVLAIYARPVDTRGFANRPNIYPESAGTRCREEATRAGRLTRSAHTAGWQPV